jgi:hypothetical protein
MQCKNAQRGVVKGWPDCQLAPTMYGAAVLTLLDHLGCKRICIVLACMARPLVTCHAPQCSVHACSNPLWLCTPWCWPAALAVGVAGSAGEGDVFDLTVAGSFPAHIRAALAVALPSSPDLAAPALHGTIWPGSTSPWSALLAVTTTTVRGPCVSASVAPTTWATAFVSVVCPGQMHTTTSY